MQPRCALTVRTLRPHHVSDHRKVGDVQVRLDREQVVQPGEGAQTASSGAHNLLKQSIALGLTSGGTHLRGVVLVITRVVVVRGKERVGGISPETQSYIHAVAEIQAQLECVAETT